MNPVRGTSCPERRLHDSMISPSCQYSVRGKFLRLSSQHLLEFSYGHELPFLRFVAQRNLRVLRNCLEYHDQLPFNLPTDLPLRGHEFGHLVQLVVEPQFLLHLPPCRLKVSLTRIHVAGARGRPIPRVEENVLGSLLQVDLVSGV